MCGTHNIFSLSRATNTQRLIVCSSGTGVGALFSGFDLSFFHIFLSALSPLLAQVFIRFSFFIRCTHSMALLHIHAHIHTHTRLSALLHRSKDWRWGLFDTLDRDIYVLHYLKVFFCWPAESWRRRGDERTRAKWRYLEVNSR